MPNFAIIENGTVTNIIVAPSGWSRDGVSTSEIQAGKIVEIGGVWDAANSQTVPVTKPVQVPQSVSRFQARAALHNAGKLAAVETLMAAAETPMLMKLAWQDAQEFQRSSVTVSAMASALGLSAAQTDALFIAAAQITA